MNININETIFLTIISFFYSTLLLIAFFSKTRLKTKENNIYSKLLIINYVGIVLEILCCIFSGIVGKYTDLYIIINKSYLLYLLVWSMTFLIYVLEISVNKEQKNYNKIKKIKMFCLLFVCIEVFLILIFPIEFCIENGHVMYSYGKAINILFFGVCFEIISMLICLILNFKKIKIKKYLPLFVFLLIGTFVTIIQSLYPNLLLTTSMETFITVLMYFTIENPDMKLLDEAHEAKEIADKSNYEKSMFLYDMTQEIRSTTDTINDYADVILETDSIDEKDDGARNIKTTTAKFSANTNDILDINNINDRNIKVYNDKYSIKLLIKELVASYKDKIVNKGIDFRTRIDSTLSDNLCGDKINLKRVIGIILDNALKYTSSGFIELDIDSIVKYDICRLVITIEDSGTGIKASEIDKIFNKKKEEYGIDNSLTDNLHNANNLINAMGGTIVVMSDYEKGSKFKIIIDQKIDEDKSDTVSKYEEMYEKIDILLVEDSEAGIKIAKKVFGKIKNISVDIVSSGRECLDKIRNKERYDYIFVDEEMEPIDGHELMLKLKEIKSFKTPVILLSQNNSIEFDDDYKKEGFSNYLLKPLDKEKVLKIIKESK